MDNFEYILSIIKKNRRFLLFHTKKQFIKKIYLEHFNKPLEYSQVETYNQKLHQRKLSQNPLLSKCSDKYTVRDYVASKIGKEYLIPIYFCKKYVTLHDLKSLPNSFAIKTTSGSGTNIIVKDKSTANLEKICKKINAYTKIKYGYLWGEFFYNKSKNRIIAEKLLTKENIYDYKIHCFRDKKGELRQIIEVLWGPKNDRHKSMYDKDWEPLPYYFSIKPDGKKFDRPPELPKLLELSSKLSEDFNYVRVDFYIIDRRIYFGELTFVPAAGFGKFCPQKYDKIWGDWINTSLEEL